MVVEARERSGALITADFALELGRDVFAVPGEITSGLSAGTNDLLRQGAAPLTSVRDVLDALGIETVTEMESRLGVGRERYRNAERGLGLGHALGVQICRTFAGMSLDWLYLGDPRGLSLTMAERLGELPTANAPPSKRRKGVKE